MNVIAITRLYDLLTTKLGKETAENLTNFIENKINHELENKSQILATKEDLAKFATKEDLAKFATKEDLAYFATKEDLAKLGHSTIKWMFIFWVGQLAATFGFILLFLTK